MSKIVLGGASFIQLNNRELSRLLDTAATLGINKIDTAPLYGRSEAKIGSYLKKRKNHNWKISTKVGLPNTLNFNPSGIIAQVNQSLHNLQVERIETLFIHSLSTNYLTNENLHTLQRLKEIGKIASIGYSGDNQDLGIATHYKVLDSIMATLNPLDMGNYPVTRHFKPENQVFLKRVLANGAWDPNSNHSKGRFTQLLRNLGIRKNNNFYKDRLNVFQTSMAPDAKTYFNFARSCNPKAFLVIGVSQLSHLQELRSIEMEPNPISEQQIIDRYAEYVTLSRVNGWMTLT